MECSNHEAAAKSGKGNNRKDITGMGAVVCGRHGVHPSRGCVNIKKGET